MDNVARSNCLFWKERVSGRNARIWDACRKGLVEHSGQEKIPAISDSDSNQNTVRWFPFKAGETSCLTVEGTSTTEKKRDIGDENGNVIKTVQALPSREYCLLPSQSNNRKKLLEGIYLEEEDVQPVLGSKERKLEDGFSNHSDRLHAGLTDATSEHKVTKDCLMHTTPVPSIPLTVVPAQAAHGLLPLGVAETDAIRRVKSEVHLQNSVFDANKNAYQNSSHECFSASCSPYSCGMRSALAFPDMLADVGEAECMHCDSDLLCPLTPEDAETSYDTPVIKESDNCEMMSGKTILVTGGAGYIGSHSVIELVEAGYEIVVIDNLVNASMESIHRVEKIVGKTIPSYSVDLLDKAALEEVFNKHTINAVIHFAGLKAVGESCELPLLYYKTNVGGTTNLLEVMEKHKIYNLVFSSSATVYGKPQFLPLTEEHPVGGCTNPYGKTKFMIEQILQDLSASNKNWNIVMLRYFNPVGSHKSGMIGEDPQGVPNNLMPYIAQVAVGRRDCLKIYGSDYDTHDGTGVRDYIHVVDLAQGHVAAVKKLEENCGLKVYNLGTGQGYSVLDMVKAFEKASGKKIPYELADRRPGDVASCYSDPSKAAKELNWTAKKGLDEMCEDLWRWQSQNPQGYNTPSS